MQPHEWFCSGDATLFLLKRDGRVFNDLPAHLSPKVIMVMDVSSPIEAGDMLIRALPDGLQVGFVVDDPGKREGLGSIPARFEVEAHWAAPIDSREGSDFWRRLRAELEKLSIRQDEALGSDREHPKWLRGFCSRLDDDEQALCEIDGGLDSEFRSRFEDIATQAAIALGSPANVSTVAFWVCCLCLDLLQNWPELAETELLQPVPAGGFIIHLLRASPAYCSRLAAMADRKANERRRVTSAEISAQPESAIPSNPETHQAIFEKSNAAQVAQQTRAHTVARLIRELDDLKPQMFEDEAEYKKIGAQNPDFLAFKIAENRPHLKRKILAIRGSTRHIRLAQELAAAHHGRQLSTIKEDWKNFKPAEFRRPK